MIALALAVFAGTLLVACLVFWALMAFGLRSSFLSWVVTVLPPIAVGFFVLAWLANIAGAP